MFDEEEVMIWVLNPNKRSSPRLINQKWKEWVSENVFTWMLGVMEFLEMPVKWVGIDKQTIIILQTPLCCGQLFQK